MRSRDQIAQDLEALRGTFTATYGGVYDDGQLAALLFAMAREKMLTAMRSTLQGYSAAELGEAILVLEMLQAPPEEPEPEAAAYRAAYRKRGRPKKHAVNEK